MNHSLYPLQLHGVTKSPIWGGTRLLREWNKKSDLDTVGESWELAVRRDAVCVVANGVFSGKPLSELIALFGASLLGKDVSDDPFPLLVKLIDAHDRLSVQVHPDDAYALRVEQDLGKTELWYILEADPGAEIIMGLKDGKTCEDLARAVSCGRTEDCLMHRQVRAGECYFIPAGMPHAIGKGILIAEIQQNCDLTYRLYDYDRRQADGSLRELHVEKALDVIRPFSEDEVRALQYEYRETCDADGALLAACRYFCLEQIKPSAEQAVRLAGGRMRHLLCIAGGGFLQYAGRTYPVSRGDSYLLPACLGDVLVQGEMMLLSSLVPKQA